MLGNSDISAISHTVTGAINVLNGNKSDIGHIHDDRYYTESEVDDKVYNRMVKPDWLHGMWIDRGSDVGTGKTYDRDVMISVNARSDNYSVWIIYINGAPVWLGSIGGIINYDLYYTSPYIYVPKYTPFNIAMFHAAGTIFDTFLQVVDCWVNS